MTVIIMTVIIMTVIIMTLSIMTVIIMTLSIMTVITMTLSMMTQHKSSTCGCRQKLVWLWWNGWTDKHRNRQTGRGKEADR